MYGILFKDYLRNWNKIVNSSGIISTIVHIYYFISFLIWSYIVCSCFPFNVLMIFLFFKFILFIFLFFIIHVLFGYHWFHKGIPHTKKYCKLIPKICWLKNRFLWGLRFLETTFGEQYCVIVYVGHFPSPHFDLISVRSLFSTTIYLLFTLN